MAGVGTLLGQLTAAPLPATMGGTGVATAAAEQTRLGIGAAGLADCCGILSFPSSTSIMLAPNFGSSIVIGSTVQTIPSGGVTLSGQTSLSTGTLYYVYAYMNGSALALKLSTTAYLLDAAGRAYMSNGASTPAADGLNRLVGMVYTNTASAPFQDSPSFRGLANHYPAARRTKKLTLTASNSNQSTSLAALTGASYVLNWGDEAVDVRGICNAYSSSAGAQLGFGYSVGGSQSGQAGYSTQPTANANISIPTIGGGTATEGQHGYAALGSCSAGTGNYSFTLEITTRL